MKNTRSLSIKHKDNPQRDFFFFVFLLNEKEEDTVGEKQRRDSKEGEGISK